MRTIRFQCGLKLACVVLLPLLLTQCGMVGSAAQLLMTPVRMANGLLSDGGAAVPERATDEQLINRAREIRERGDYRGPSRQGEVGALTAATASEAGRQP